ncbi:CRISPR-associated RAMP protein Csx7, partial [Desulfobacterales bacterium HSG17]|nr:CRISPR-associated RAMP protein Csx7 [Desulfobacterales bacterium HSG17]
KKVRITGNLVFDTAFHIGSGKEGEGSSDMGVLIDPDGIPILPGSTLKGNFRAFAERLSQYLGMKSCLLDSDLSGIKCVSDEKYRTNNDGKKISVYEEFKELKTEKQKLEWLPKHTCNVCQLFGSPLQASRIFFSDGNLEQGGDSILIRDGVCIDRDTETARHGAKYDFEVVPKGAVFSISIDIENPEDNDLALVAAALGEWENGFRLGGFTSRGLGKVRLTDKKIEAVDYKDPDALLNYLISKKMQKADELLENSLINALSALKS